MGMDDGNDAMAKRVARAVREEVLRQLREDERRKCPAGADFYEDEIGPWLIARAAIEAMREPTEAAVLAGAKAGVDQIYYKSNAWERCVDDEFKGDHLNYARYAWTAMIDAALRQ